MVVPLDSGDQTPSLFLKTSEKVSKLGEKVDGLENNFGRLDSDLNHLYHKVQGVEDNHQRNILANKELPVKVESMEQQVKLGFHTLMERNKVFVADQRQMLTTLDELSHQQKHSNTDFDHFARQVGLNEAHFEQRHHEHAKDIFEHAQEIHRLKEDNAR